MERLVSPRVSVLMPLLIIACMISVVPTNSKDKDYAHGADHIVTD